MNHGSVKAIILYNTVGVGSNMSPTTMIDYAGLFGVACGFIPCTGTIVTFSAARSFDDRYINACAFFKNNTSLLENRNGLMK